VECSNPESYRVSIVEDDKAVRDALYSLLESTGLMADAFGSAEEFVDDVRAKDSSCLILDVRLPFMSGLELQFYLAGRNPMPTIFITGHSDEKVREQALQNGAVGFFHKPFSPNALLNAVRSTLR
jgi:FixJ family two-component response regulator